MSEHDPPVTRDEVAVELFDLAHQLMSADLSADRLREAIAAAQQIIDKAAEYLALAHNDQRSGL